MDEFFVPKAETMVPPFVQGAARTNPPTESDNSLPKWITGGSGIKDELGVPGFNPQPQNSNNLPSSPNPLDMEIDYLLYYYPHSFFSQKVMMALYEKDLPFKTRMVNINLGEQFHDDFLQLNPRAEVPVLRDFANQLTIADSNTILNYLELSLKSKPEIRKLLPETEPWKSLHEEFVQKFACLRIDALTLGASYYGKFCHLDPHYPYNYTPARLQLQEIALQRVNILRHEAERVIDINPDASEALFEKAMEAEAEGPLMRDIREFEKVIKQFEHTLNDVEAQLQKTWIEENHPDHWLICPFVTHADITFGLVLQRLWQLGFGERVFTKNRPHITCYWKRMKRVDSFKKTVSVEPEVNYWPYIIGAGACVLLFVIEGVWRRRR